MRGRGSGDGSDGRFGHLAHEAVADAVHGRDQPLVRTVVPDRAASGLDPAGQRRVAHEPVAPDLVEQLGLGDHPVAMDQQEGEDVEDLWLDVHRLPAPAQLDPGGIEAAIVERVHRETFRAGPCIVEASG